MASQTTNAISDIRVKSVTFLFTDSQRMTPRITNAIFHQLTTSHIINALFPPLKYLCQLCDYFMTSHITKPPFPLVAQWLSWRPTNSWRHALLALFFNYLVTHLGGKCDFSFSPPHSSWHRTSPPPFFLANLWLTLFFHHSHNCLKSQKLTTHLLYYVFFSQFQKKVSFILSFLRLSYFFFSFFLHHHPCRQIQTSIWKDKKKCLCLSAQNTKRQREKKARRKWTENENDRRKETLGQYNVNTSMYAVLLGLYLCLQ
jgi:hypothetical protein